MNASRSARIPKYVFPLALAGIVGIATPTSGCGGSGGNSGFGGGGGNGSGANGGSGGSFSSSSGGGSGNGSGGTVACPSGLQCNVSCSSGTTTSISGVVYDPAGKDPLYNIAVYVPATPLKQLPSGVPTGSDACSCGALFPSGSVVQTATGVDGSFKLTNAPVGNVPLVIQVGKWRRLFQVNTTACQNTALPSRMLTLPSTVPAGDTNTSMPQIAVSTGGADTLECLMTRIGLPTSEYVSGAGGAGHVHLFAGGQQGGGGGGGGGGGHQGGGGGGGGGGQIGQPEQGTAGVFPESDTNLWDSQTHLMPYDILLLSCEGGETYNANPSVLQAYLNAGGRAFGSHYHYAWFSGPIDSGQSYSAPPGWGSALATWSGGGGNTNGQANGKIEQALNGSTQPFPKGVALYQWLGLNGALGALNAPMGELPMVPPRYNAVVGPNNTPSQPWVQDDTTANTMYFSFDTPIGGMTNPDGGAALYCGRAVFSDLHVGGETMPADSPPPPPAGPGGCTQADLSPQEKALEFMLFDLSSCVIPDSVQPQQPDGGGIVQ